MENRRSFIKSLTLGAGVAIMPHNMFAYYSSDKNKSIACQQYTWYTYYQREGKIWMENPHSSLNDISKSGIPGYEPSFDNPEQVKELKMNLDRQEIWSSSMYVNSVLHGTQLVEKNIQHILAIATEAKNIGIKILVTNPTPLKWGGLENKTDEQLKTQAIALNLLGKELKSIGIKLAYHNHDAEMREGAREFHHMLSGTDPDNVKLCLDAHWIYRGSGNSQVALFDIVEIYSDRIIELHLRQSHNGIWTEVFEDGDIDYNRLAGTLKKKGIKPHIVLEQAIEEGTPHTMDTVEAMSKSLAYVKNVFNEIL